MYFSSLTQMDLNSSKIHKIVLQYLEVVELLIPALS